MALLEINDLHTYYGKIHALRGVSLTVDEGEIVTLIGANGAGKTTTLNTVSSLLVPKQGSVIFEGEDLTHVPAHKVVVREPELLVGLPVERQPRDRGAVGVRDSDRGRDHRRIAGRGAHPFAEHSVEAIAGIGDVEIHHRAIVLRSDRDPDLGGRARWTRCKQISGSTRG